MMTAASMLLGLTLDDGWTVVKHKAKSPNGTGGTFSESYEVVRADQRGFLKAFDFTDAFLPGADTLDELRKLIDAFEHERDVLQHCGNRRLSNVVTAVGFGTVDVPGQGQVQGRVYYLIFELAQSDVRVQMDLRTQLVPAQCLKALKDVTLGLFQVHREMIAHQDTKPSNVLAYEGDQFKIADFGRSSQRGRSPRHDGFRIAGDPSYAPPELTYGFTHEDFIPRRFGCDLYMLGNLAAFMFSGVNLTSRLLQTIDPQHHPQQWRGTYEQVLPYLVSAFATVLGELETQIDERVRKPVSALIGELSNPDLAKRGHPNGIGRPGQYSLERYVSQLDLEMRRLAIRMRSDLAKAA